MSTSPPDREKKLEQNLAYFFGVIFIVIILILAIAFPQPTRFQYTVFRIILALAAAGVASVIPGFLQVEVSKFVRAGGAIAVFVVVFFFSPAQLAVEEVAPNPDALNITVGDDQTVEQIVEKVEQYTQVIITFDQNCGESVRKAVVKSKDTVLSGENVEDFLQKLRNRIRENSQVNYSVNVISKGERYEIACK